MAFVCCCNWIVFFFVPHFIEYGELKKIVFVIVFDVFVRIRIKKTVKIPLSVLLHVLFSLDVLFSLAGGAAVS